MSDPKECHAQDPSRAHDQRKRIVSSPDARSGVVSRSALLGLQRAAGNAAVATMVQRPHVLAAVAGLHSLVPRAMHVKMVDEGTPDRAGDARVLGLSTPPSKDKLQLPQVHVDDVPGGVALRVTAATDSDDFSSVSVGAGVIAEKDNVKVRLLGGNAAIVDPDFPPGSITLAADTGEKDIVEEFMTVICRIEPATADLIRRNEQEHPDDFAQAFKVSAVAVVTAVESLKGRVFLTPGDAMAALSGVLDKRLMPRWPLMPEAWPQHVFLVLDRLYDLSKERDRLGEHNPTSRRGTLDRQKRRLEFSPDLKAPGSRPTKSWITLDNASDLPPHASDPSLPIPALPWAVRQGLLLTRDHTSPLVTQDLTQETDDRTLHKGTFGTFLGHVVYQGELRLRIDLDDGHCVLLKPQAAALFVPGVRPPPPVVVPAGPVTLAVGQKSHLRDTATRKVFFFETVDAAKDTRPRHDDMENGPANVFAREELVAKESFVRTNPDTNRDEDAYLVWKQGDYGDLYGVVFATEVVPA